MNNDKNVEVRHEEKKSEPSLIGVALIKYATYLIIFFGIIWFVIRYIFPLF
ncbi:MULTISPECIES: hypothetical protein [unclassified Virgibacillus]|uniref:hypothetical protein n=1 Tax=unclassified Virgibacillus TaxID=2620237 RepID=UPI0024DEDF1E|nr:hypothetical protein [Virgibacillus sp. LDC-1]